MKNQIFLIWELITSKEGVSTLPCPPKGGTFN